MAPELRTPMRIYIIGNDGITLSRAAPAIMTEGEIAVASKEELHAAPLSGKRLLALWNALPSVGKRRKVGDRGALIDQLWFERWIIEIIVSNFAIPRVLECLSVG